MSIASSLVSAIIGGLIGGGFALLATRQAHRNERRRIEEERKTNICGVLQAIRTEVEISMKDYDLSVGELLEKMEKGQPFTRYFTLTRDTLIVYPNNTHIIG